MTAAIAWTSRSNCHTAASMSAHSGTWGCRWVDVDTHTMSASIDHACAADAPTCVPPNYIARRERLAQQGRHSLMCFICAVVTLTALLVVLLASFVPARRLFATCIVAEGAFYIYYRVRYWQLNRQPAECHEPQHHSHNPHRNFERLMDAVIMQRKLGASQLEVNSVLAGWVGAPPDLAGVRRGNIEKMLAYSFFYRSADGMRAAGLGGLLRAMVLRLESVLGLDFEEGYQSGMQGLEHLWEPLRTWHRPILFYVIMQLVEICVHWVMVCGYGFTTGHVDGVKYFVHSAELLPDSVHRRAGGRASDRSSISHSGSNADHPAEQGSRAPILFLHGVGAGLAPYLMLVRGLVASGAHVIAPEFRHVSMRMCWSIPSMDDLVQTLESILDQEKVQQVCLMGHSYGTLLASRMLLLHPERLMSLALVDPVCVGMYIPTLLQSFIYRTPRWGSVAQFLEDFLTYFISRDLHVAATFCRQFYWSDLNLWELDVPPKTFVVLSALDKLLDARQVQTYLSHRVSKLLLHPSHAHAGILMDSAWIDTVVAEVASLHMAGCQAQQPSSEVLEKKQQ